MSDRYPIVLAVLGENIVETSQINSWKMFSSKIEQWENSALMFRGVTAAKHDLIPKIGRPDTRIDNGVYSRNHEMHMFNQFKAHACAYLDKMPNTDIEWLVLAQHHGLPTRLLDWSLSPLVAAYFAVEKMGSHTRKADESEEDFLPAIYVAARPQITDDYFRTDFELFPDTHYTNYDGEILPTHISPRISAQKALLTIHGEPTVTYKPPKLEKVLISKGFSAVLKRMLMNLGISRGSLFPGLDGVAADLAWNYKWAGYQWETLTRT